MRVINRMVFSETGKRVLLQLVHAASAVRFGVGSGAATSLPVRQPHSQVLGNLTISSSDTDGSIVAEGERSPCPAVAPNKFLNRFDCRLVGAAVPLAAGGAFPN
jgi:hypothetical protein